jgi:hypothetical protein
VGWLAVRVEIALAPTAEVTAARFRPTDHLSLTEGIRLAWNSASALVQKTGGHSQAWRGLETAVRLSWSRGNAVSSSCAWTVSGVCRGLNWTPIRVPGKQLASKSYCGTASAASPAVSCWRDKMPMSTTCFHARWEAQMSFQT